MIRLGSVLWILRCDICHMKDIFSFQFFHFFPVSDLGTYFLSFQFFCFHSFPLNTEEIIDESQFCRVFILYFIFMGVNVYYEHKGLQCIKKRIASLLLGNSSSCGLAMHTWKRRSNNSRVIAPSWKRTMGKVCERLRNSSAKLHLSLWINPTCYFWAL